MFFAVLQDLISIQIIYCKIKMFPYKITMIRIILRGKFVCSLLNIGLQIFYPFNRLF